MVASVCMCVQDCLSGLCAFWGSTIFVWGDADFGEGLDSMPSKMSSVPLRVSQQNSYSGSGWSLFYIEVLLCTCGAKKKRGILRGFCRNGIQNVIFNFFLDEHIRREKQKKVLVAKWQHCEGSAQPIWKQASDHIGPSPDLQGLHTCTPEGRAHARGRGCYL